MPRIDVNDVDCRNDKIAANNFIKSLNGISDKIQTFNSINNTIALKSTNDTNQFHSPKVFASDSIKVNTPAKDVLGAKFDKFTKNLKQSFVMPAESAVFTKINGMPNGNANGHLMNGMNGTNGTNGNGGLPKLQPLSACYDRYPKPGSYGSLQIFPMNGINSEINNTKENICDESPQRHRIRDDRKPDDEITKLEQDRLEEILKMCADFERQNQNVQSSPIVQNRIKTNGSLPREKKSPLSPEHNGGTANVFFPPSPGDFRSNQPSSPHTPHKTNTGYENVKLLAARKHDLSASSSRFENLPPKSADQHHHLMNGNSMNGYENMMSPLKSPVGYVPQSPRTRIKTCISPKKELTSTPIQRKTDYDLLVQSFEEKLRLEIQQLRENRSIENNRNSLANRKTNQKSEPPPIQPKPTQNALAKAHQYVNVNVNRSANSQEGIYGTLTNKNKSNNHLTLNIKKNLDDKQIAQLKKQQIDVVRKARELKAQIAELQQQEEEVLREVNNSIGNCHLNALESSLIVFFVLYFQLDLEKVLVSAELRAEQEQLNEMEKTMSAFYAKMHRLEAQRNANRVLQETQQNKLKQSIDMKQNQVEG